MRFVKTLSFALMAGFCSHNISAQEWVRADYAVSGQGETIQLSFSENTPAPDVILLETGTPRLVLDWDKMTPAIDGADIGQGQKAIAGEGPVQRFRYAARGTQGLRLVMELAEGAKFAGTKNLGDSLLVKFASGRVDPASAAAFDPFTYNVPIPRLKPSAQIGGTVGQSAVATASPQPENPEKNVQVTPPHNAFLYDVPIPRLKPNQGQSRWSGSTGSPVKATSLDLYTPAKRYFKSGELPYPRTAPHIGAGQQVALIRRAPKAPKAVVSVRGKPVIVIDPGHGGYDPGAIGAKGTKEKQITSAVTKRLSAMLRKTGRYDIVITRTKDVYVDHDDRLRIARERGADLFISIHADSTENGKAAGASVYTLADRAKNRSKKITHTQNWIVDVDLSEQTASVGDILVDLAQRKTQSHSAEFADVLVTELEKTVPLVRNTHRRAGYYVLLAPDVPAVLLELGFISNAADERRLNKVSEQDKIIKAVIKAINGYFNAKKP